MLKYLVRRHYVGQLEQCKSSVVGRHYMCLLEHMVPSSDYVEFIA